MENEGGLLARYLTMARITNPRQRGVLLARYLTMARIINPRQRGYRNGNRVSRFGIDAAWVQDLFQNGIHRWVVPTPYYNTNYGSPSAPFLQGGYVNPFSLYTF
ncbi:MAG: hypothetical protein KGZ82_07190 [Bacteroidales bacterium]|nr:hypothetical protein [Bacteroidales bacterium]